VQPIITLTDKDLSEINAFLAEFPDSKHQLCFWHCLHAIKKRLSILHHVPAFYDVEGAWNEFSWIDQDFVPIGQVKPGTQVSTRKNQNGNGLTGMSESDESNTCSNKGHPPSDDQIEWHSSASSNAYKRASCNPN